MWSYPRNKTDPYSGKRRKREGGGVSKEIWRDIFTGSRDQSWRWSCAWTTTGRCPRKIATTSAAPPSSSRSRRFPARSTLSLVVALRLSRSSEQDSISCAAASPCSSAGESTATAELIPSLRRHRHHFRDSGALRLSEKGYGRRFVNTPLFGSPRLNFPTGRRLGFLPPRELIWLKRDLIARNLCSSSSPPLFCGQVRIQTSVQERKNFEWGVGIVAILGKDGEMG